MDKPIWDRPGRDGGTVPALASFRRERGPSDVADTSPLQLHAEWMAALREYCYGTPSLDPRSVACEDGCAVGRWLADLEPRHHTLSEFHEAARLHARFHRHAATIVYLADGGRRLEALHKLGPEGDIRTLSREMVRSLNRLRDRIAAEAV